MKIYFVCIAIRYSFSQLIYYSPRKKIFYKVDSNACSSEIYEILLIMIQMYFSIFYLKNVENIYHVQTVHQ